MDDLSLSKAVVLTGMTLTGQLLMRNTNENLAIMFEIVTVPSKLIDVTPNRGIIMTNETKKIKVHIPSSARKAVNQQFTGELVIHTTMNSQYNKRLMRQSGLKGWSQVQHAFQTFSIPVTIGERKDTHLQNSKKLSDSNLKHQNRNSRHISHQNSPDYIRSSIKNHSAHKSYQSHSANNRSEVSNSKRAPKLEQELEFISHKDSYQNSRTGNAQNQYARYDILPTDRPGLSNKAVSEYNNAEFVLADYNLSNYSRRFSKDQSRKTSFNTNNNKLQQIAENLHQFPQHIQKPINLHPSLENRKPDQRSLQIVILAIIAGFFVALGSNIGKIFN